LGYTSHHILEPSFLSSPLPPSMKRDDLYISVIPTTEEGDQSSWGESQYWLLLHTGPAILLFDCLSMLNQCNQFIIHPRVQAIFKWTVIQAYNNYFGVPNSLFICFNFVFCFLHESSAFNICVLFNFALDFVVLTVWPWNPGWLNEFLLARC